MLPHVTVFLRGRMSLLASHAECLLHRQASQVHEVEPSQVIPHHRPEDEPRISSAIPPGPGHIAKCRME